MIPQPEIDRIRANTDLVSLVRSYGITLTKVGRELAGLCPFHSDSTASFFVNPAGHVFKCHGCNAGGDVIEFVMKYESVDFVRAMQILTNGRGHLSQKTGAVPMPEKTPIDLCSPENQKLACLVLEHYEKSLRVSSQAQKYLMDRGLVHPELLSNFRIGYADGSLLRILPSREADEGRQLYSQLQQIGIVTEHGREFFHGYIIIAVADENGVILNLYGRNISKYSKRPAHLYLTSHTGILNPRCLISDTVIVVESPIDLLSFYVAGVRNVTCTYGTNGYSSRLASVLQQHGVKRVLVAFDADEAGERGTTGLMEKLRSAGIESLRVSLPDGMDPNDALVQIGSDFLRTVALFTGAENRMAGINTDPEPSLTETRVAPESEIRTSKKTLFVSKGDRAYRIDGFYKNLSEVTLSITLSVSREAKEHTDRLDLYVSKDREKFSAKAAKKLELKEEVIESDLDFLLPQLRRMQDAHITESEKPKEEKKEIDIPPERLQRAMQLVKDPEYYNLTVRHAKECGLVGESDNFMIGYLILISRILAKPLHGMARSSSAAGKSTLLDYIARFCPPEDLIRLTTISSQAFYYMESLSHRVVLIEEDAGMEQARYALKMLQSEGVLRKSTVTRDPQTGKSAVQMTETPGPVASIVASTGTSDAEEEHNRYLFLALNETTEQTSAILAYQREQETKDEEEMEKDCERIIELHRDCLRLTRPVPVKNPYANRLTFLSSRHRFRRDQPKYLKIIRLLTLMHQYQRERVCVTKNGASKEYVLSTIEDNIRGTHLARISLGHSLDEMSPHTRHFLVQFSNLVEEMAKERKVEQRHIRVLRRDLMKKTGLSRGAVHDHLMVLASLDYVILHRDDRGRNACELIYEGEGENGEKFIPGIPDAQMLRKSLEEFEKEMRRKIIPGKSWWEIPSRAAEKDD